MARASRPFTTSLPRNLVGRTGFEPVRGFPQEAYETSDVDLWSTAPRNLVLAARFELATFRLSSGRPSVCARPEQKLGGR